MPVALTGVDDLRTVPPRAGRTDQPIDPPRISPAVLTRGKHEMSVLIAIFSIALGFALLILLWLGVAVGPLIPGGQSGSHPIGSAFSVAAPAALSQCLPPDSFAGNGCAAGHYGYRLEIQQSTIAFGSFLCKVSTGSGSIAVVPDGLGFSILNSSGVVMAQYSATGGSMYMTSGWTYEHGIGPATALPFSDFLVIDMGTDAAQGLGYVFYALGAGGYSGTTAGLALP